MILDVIVEDKLKRLPEHKKRISEEEMTRLAIHVLQRKTILREVQNILSR